MKRLLFLGLIFCAGAARAQITQLLAGDVGLGFVGADGTPIVTGKIILQPTDLNGNPLAVNVGGTGGLMLPRSALCLLANGAITTSLSGSTCAVVSTATSNPDHFCYKVTVEDTVNHWSPPPMTCVQPSGATWSFDTYVPSGGPTALTVTGPTGATGPAGPANSLSIGTVTAVPNGTTPTASIVGTAPNQTLNLGLEIGAPGSGGGGSIPGVTADGNNGIDVVGAVAAASYSAGTAYPNLSPPDWDGANPKLLGLPSGQAFPLTAMRSIRIFADGDSLTDGAGQTLTGSGADPALTITSASANGSTATYIYTYGGSDDPFLGPPMIVQVAGCTTSALNETYAPVIAWHPYTTTTGSFVLASSATVATESESGCTGVTLQTSWRQFFLPIARGFWGAGAPGYQSFDLGIAHQINASFTAASEVGSCAGYWSASQANAPGSLPAVCAYALGGRGLYVLSGAGTAADYFAWAPSSHWDYAVVYYLQCSTCGTFILNTLAQGTSGSTVTNNSGTLKLASVTIYADASDSGLEVHHISGAVTLFGADFGVFNDTGVTITNLARGGRKAADYQYFDSSFQSQWFTALQPDIYTWEIGINDDATLPATCSGSHPCSVGDYIQTGVTAVQAASPGTRVVLLHSSQSSNYATTNQDSYEAVQRSLALQYGTGFLSVKGLFGSYAEALSMGWMWSDGIHHTIAGNMMEARAVAAYLGIPAEGRDPGGLPLSRDPWRTQTLSTELLGTSLPTGTPVIAYDLGLAPGDPTVDFDITIAANRSGTSGVTKRRVRFVLQNNSTTANNAATIPTVNSFTSALLYKQLSSDASDQDFTVQVSANNSRVQLLVTPTGHPETITVQGTWTVDTGTGVGFKLYPTVYETAASAGATGTSPTITATVTDPYPYAVTSGVTAGSYTNANLTVGADGRVTAASNGSGGNGTVSSGTTGQFATYPSAGTTVQGYTLQSSDITTALGFTPASGAPSIALTPGDLACGMAGDTAIGSTAITSGSSTGSAATLGFSSGSSTPLFYTGQKIGVTGATPSGLNGGPYTITGYSGSPITSLTFASSATAWTSGGTIYLWCANSSDAISATPYTFQSTYSVPANTAGVSVTSYRLTAPLDIWSTSAGVPNEVLQLFYNTTQIAGSTLASAVSMTAIGGALTWGVIPISSSLFLTSLDAATGPWSVYSNAQQQTHTPTPVTTTSTYPFQVKAYFSATGCCGGTALAYSSGGTSCTNGTQTVGTFNNSCSGTTGTISVSGNVPTGNLTIVNHGYGCTAVPTTATVATCTGTTTFTTTGAALAGPASQAVMMHGLIERP